jgi:hypothetical protein
VHRAGLSIEQLRKQLFSGLCILNEDRTDGAILRGFEDLLDSVTVGIDSFRLTVLIEPEDLWSDRLTHGVPNTGLVIDPDAQLSSQCRPPIAK